MSVWEQVNREFFSLLSFNPIKSFNSTFCSKLATLTVVLSRQDTRRERYQDNEFFSDMQIKKAHSITL